jgi:hypothetical protein
MVDLRRKFGEKIKMSYFDFVDYGPLSDIEKKKNWTKAFWRTTRFRLGKTRCRLAKMLQLSTPNAAIVTLLVLIQTGGIGLNLYHWFTKTPQNIKEPEITLGLNITSVALLLVILILYFMEEKAYEKDRGIRNIPDLINLLTAANISIILTPLFISYG